MTVATRQRRLLDGTVITEPVGSSRAERRARSRTLRPGNRADRSVRAYRRANPRVETEPEMREPEARTWRGPVLVKPSARKTLRRIARLSRKRNR